MTESANRERRETMTTQRHPYSDQPDRAFWRRTVEQANPLEIGDWYRKKFSLAGRRIATAGSCFAQHLGREIKHQGYAYVDVEPAPGFLPADLHLDFGYGIYSARYGNIYTSRQWLQLIERAFGDRDPLDRAWPCDGGFVDPFRPNIEPGAVGSADDVEVLRRDHLACVRQLFEQTDVFVFTLGLTETWMRIEDGTVFPIAPGARAGVWDETLYRFLNLSYGEVVDDLEAVIARLRTIKPDMQFIFTVSPVALLATASQEQVVVANSYSKSILRAAAGFLTDRYPFVDYFPSYEITSSPPMRAIFYNTDTRTISSAGVRHVMSHFVGQHAGAPQSRVQVGGRAPVPLPPPTGPSDPDRVLCDEELAAVFGRY